MRLTPSVLGPRLMSGRDRSLLLAGRVRMSRRNWLLFAAMCVLWGIPYLLIRVAVRDIAPGTLVFLRTAIGGLVLLPLALSRGGYRQVVRRWRPLVAFTVIEVAIPWLFLSDAETRLSSSLSGLLIAAVPLVGVLVARVLGTDDRVGPLRLLGLGLGVVGVGMLVGLDFGALHAWPLIEVAVVVVGYAVAPVIMARTLADLPAIPVVSSALLLTAVGYLPYALARPPRSLDAQQVWSVIVLGLVCTALAFVLFFALINQIGPARATVITYVNPAVAVLLGILLLDEDFTLGIAVGFPLILVGSVLAARRVVAAPETAGCEAGVPEAVIAETVAQAPAAQSTRTSPLGVSNTAATTPVSPSNGDSHSTSTPSSGWRADVPK
jgi:drug/metabolite transporter (DMT)-like permease